MAALESLVKILGGKETEDALGVLARETGVDVVGGLEGLRKKIEERAKRREELDKAVLEEKRRQEGELEAKMAEVDYEYEKLEENIQNESNEELVPLS